MTRTHRSSRVRLGVLATVLALGSLAAFSTVASATELRSGGFTWDLRPSWYSYITNPLFRGRIVTNEGASQEGRLIRFSFGTGSTYNFVESESGRGTINYDGFLQFRMELHYIRVDLSDPQITMSRVEDRRATLSFVASYDPLEEGTQVENPTTPTRTTIATVDLSRGFRGSASRHDWRNAPAVFTAEGATIFNGGEFGGYRAGDETGRVTFWGEIN